VPLRDLCDVDVVSAADAKLIASIARKIKSAKLDAIAADEAHGAKMRIVARVHDARKLATALR
jgi:hypothetical protein